MRGWGRWWRQPPRGRVIVSGCPAIDAQGHCIEALIGQGPRFSIPLGIAVEATGALVVVDRRVRVGRGAVMRQPPSQRPRDVSGCPAIDAQGHCLEGAHRARPALRHSFENRHRGHGRFGGGRSMAEGGGAVDPTGAGRCPAVQPSTPAGAAWGHIGVDPLALIFLWPLP